MALNSILVTVRLVSLCPSTTETLIDLGLAESIVGITRFCIRPAEIVARLPKVGGTKTPDLEAIAAASPDLVFMNAEENRREDHEALAARGLEVDVTCPRTVKEVPELLRHFGARTHTEARAELRARELEGALASLRSDRPFRFAYIIWRKPWMTVGEDTYISDLLGLAGGKNVFADAEDRYPVTSLEQIAERAPDVVLLPDEPFPFERKHLAEIAPIVAPSRCLLVSGDDLCWHGVRSIRGVLLAQDLAARISGGTSLAPYGGHGE
jgi:iron complex transport system substrate-binding protein